VWRRDVRGGRVHPAHDHRRRLGQVPRGPDQADWVGASLCFILYNFKQKRREIDPPPRGGDGGSYIPVIQSPLKRLCGETGRFRERRPRHTLQGPVVVLKCLFVSVF
jgi:hypothetical protein